MALALIAAAVVGGALIGLRLIGSNWARHASALGPWLAAAGFMFGAGVTLLAVALSIRHRGEGGGLPVRRPAWLAPPAAAAMLVAGVSLAGAVTYRLGSDLVARSILYRLETAARLKESLLQAWFEDAHEDLRLWTRSATFLRLLQDWRAAPDASAPRAALLGHLWERALGAHYVEIAICGADCGEPLLAVSDPEGSVRRMRPRAVVLAPGASTVEPVPVYLEQPVALEAQSFGVRVAIDPRHQLARLVERWPGENLSGELLLVQPEGDSLVVIADENQEGAAAVRRIRADRPSLLAEAVAKPNGLALREGLSENGEPMLAWATPVAGTRWMLLAKLDEGDAFGELHRVSGVAAALASVIALLGLWWTIEHRRYLAAAQGLLHDRAQQAQQLAEMSRRVVSAQEEERRRMAGELHDQSGANLAAIQMNLKALERRVRPRDDDDRELFQETSALLAQTVGQIRDFCADLRPADLDAAGLVEGIAAAARRLARRTGAQVHFDGSGYAVQQPAEVESILFRLAQEALLNCAKHSKARTVTIRLASSAAGRVQLEISDDGTGFETAARSLAEAGGGGQGLALMRERASLAGGRLSVVSAPGQGTTVRFEQP